MNAITNIPNQPIVIVKDGHVIADSRDVAAAFGKQHRDVLRAIDNLLSQEEQCLRNFAQTVVERPNPSGGASIQSRVFEMDRDGFVLLAMGFTGKKALKWKLAYIEAFNRMETALRSGEPMSLPADVRSTIGGIVKGVVHKELSQIIPSLVEQHILAGRYNIVEGVCAVEVAEMAGYKSGMRPRGVSQFISRRLARYHEDRGVAVKRDKRGLIRARLFDETTARNWLKAGGQSEIASYVAERRGQGRLRLVEPRALRAIAEGMDG